MFSFSLKYLTVMGGSPVFLPRRSPFFSMFFLGLVWWCCVLLCGAIQSIFLHCTPASSVSCLLACFIAGHLICEIVFSDSELLLLLLGVN